MVRGFVPQLRSTMSPEERTVGAYLRGNEHLFNSLVDLIESRIRGRATLPVPSDPLQCKAILDRDSELRWLLSRLEFVYHSPVAQPADDRSEQLG